MTVYDGNRKNVCGKIMLLVQAGPISVPEEFYVMDIPATFNLILGRRWLNHMKAVMSTRHQCIKFPHLGKIVKLMGDPPVIEPEGLQILPTLRPAPIPPGTKTHGYRVDPTISLTDIDPVRSMIPDPVPLPEPPLRKECIHGWNLMRKLGYQPGLGLGRNEDGILDPVILEARIGTEGLGFNPYDQVTLSRKDWKLGEHFVRHSKLLDPNEPPDGEGCHQIK